MAGSVRPPHAIRYKIVTDNNSDGEQGQANPNLQWMVGGKSQWKTSWAPDIWHNVAYEIVITSSVLYFYPTDLTLGF
jgi:hypothetical protein